MVTACTVKIKKEHMLYIELLQLQMMAVITLSGTYIHQ